MSPYPRPMQGYEHHQQAFGAADQSQTAVQGLGYLLGQLGAGATTSALKDPVVQATITDLKEQCQVRAKAGVSEWMLENWPTLAFATFCVLLGNYVIVSLALLNAGVRRRFFKKP